MPVSSIIAAISLAGYAFQSVPAVFHRNTSLRKAGIGFELKRDRLRCGLIILLRFTYTSRYVNQIFSIFRKIFFDKI